MLTFPAHCALSSSEVAAWATFQVSHVAIQTTTTHGFPTCISRFAPHPGALSSIKYPVPTVGLSSHLARSFSRSAKRRSGARPRPIAFASRPREELFGVSDASPKQPPTRFLFSRVIAAASRYRLPEPISVYGLPSRSWTVSIPPVGQSSAQPVHRTVNASQLRVFPDVATPGSRAPITSFVAFADQPQALAVLALPSTFVPTFDAFERGVGDRAGDYWQELMDVSALSWSSEAGCLLAGLRGGNLAGSTGEIWVCTSGSLPGTITDHYPQQEYMGATDRLR
ncbi:uncharacterized protein EV422DRAFT_506802 [Fimicolochytrium jonesii]|uniref:uncharacterized protein n=1 Tax=Fimicolochytrium jonesii TaxID=1396493 RepID=UPI0022FE6270|nr:uncharacterized protein EV422DRAFT_506802 [Fimicolochytrium jonesii]KAI8820576.1 hypothetical protein EV422DRAFT_506802 [Fimicolochytrium jonesii]